jgi:hypothetical protein
MSISIKKLASVSAVLAGIACCWRVLNLNSTIDEVSARSWLR